MRALAKIGLLLVVLGLGSMALPNADHADKLDTRNVRPWLVNPELKHTPEEKMYFPLQLGAGAVVVGMILAFLGSGEKP